MKKFLLPVLFMLCASAAVAQQGGASCAQTLRLASSIYDQGRLHELEGLLTPCLKSGGFSTSERVTALKFLALAYIYLEEPEKADQTMLQILQTDHYFEVNDQVDPAEFKALYNTFRTNEIYRLGLKLGGNMTMTNVINSNNVSTADYKYKPGFGFSASFVGEIPLQTLSPRLTFAPELQLQLSGFQCKSTSEQTSGLFVTTMKQTLSYVSIPLLVQYEFGNESRMNNKNRKIRPYATGGISPDMLIAGNRSITEIRPGFPQTQGDYKTTDVMKKFNLGLVAGAGIRMRVAGGFFIAEVRYKYGLTTVPTKGMIYSDENQVFGQKYADAAYRLNCLSLSAGYTQNFFNPKKKKPRR